MPENIPVTFAEEKEESIRVSSPEDIQLSKLDLGELARWIDKYNAQFGWGGLLGRVVIGAARETREIDVQAAMG